MKLNDIKKLAEITTKGEKILKEQIDEKYKILKESGFSDRLIYLILSENKVSPVTLRNWHLNHKKIQRSTLLKFLSLLEGHDVIKKVLEFIPVKPGTKYYYVPENPRKNTELRNKKILMEWNNDPNSTLQSIADKFKISRERVRQILSHLRLSGENVKRSKLKTKQRYDLYEKKLLEEIEIGLKDYGTTKYFEWRKLFLQGSNTPLRSRTLKKVLMKRWNEDLDPLLNFQISIELKPEHYLVLDLRKDGKTLDEICEVLNKSKPMITNYLRDLREHGLVGHASPNQVKSVALKDYQIQKKLDLIRDDLRKGGDMNDVRHFVHRHFLYPYYVNQKKQKEKANNSIIRIVSGGS